MYSLGQAARAVGKAKSTISRDVKSGKISASRNADGSLAIDPAELHRVYPPAVFERNGSNGIDNGRSNDSQPHLDPPGNTFLTRENALLRDQLAETRETIRNLWQRLDASEAERRQLAERLAGLLTARAEALSPLPAAEPQRAAASPVPPIDATPPAPAASSGGFCQCRVNFPHLCRSKIPQFLDHPAV